MKIFDGIKDKKPTKKSNRKFKITLSSNDEVGLDGLMEALGIEIHDEKNIKLSFIKKEIEESFSGPLDFYYNLLDLDCVSDKNLIIDIEEIKS